MCRSDSIEMGDANFDPKVFLQFCLKMRTCHLWSRTTALYEALEHRFMHFRRMSMPSIVESSFPLSTVGGKPSVRRGPTSMHACSAGCFLPRGPFLHEHHHLSFGFLCLLCFHHTSLPAFHDTLCFSAASLRHLGSPSSINTPSIGLRLGDATCLVRCGLVA
jgi:hypothetical protein